MIGGLDTMEFSRCVLSAIPFGILAYDVDGAVMYANAKAGVLLDCTEEELLDSNVVRLFGALPHTFCIGKAVPDEDWVRWPLRRVLNFGMGRSFRCHFSKEKWEEEGSDERELYCLTFRDVTEEQEKTKRRERSLQVSSMFNLLPALAHEIKNPLAGIQSMVEVVREEVTNQQHAEELGVVLDELDRMRFLVDRMRLVDHKLWEATTEYELVSPLATTLRPLSIRAEHLGLQFLRFYPGTVYAQLHPDMIRMLVLNLVNNAFDACARGDNVVFMLDVEEDAGHLKLEVSDTGRGMSVDVLERAQELFYSTKSMGSGIGLALVREVAELFGGTLSIESKESEGTRVTVRLPMKKSS